MLREDAVQQRAQPHKLPPKPRRIDLERLDEVVGDRCHYAGPVNHGVTA
jgi:hypothetical protein